MRSIFALLLIGVNIFFASAQKNPSFERYINSYKNLAIQQEKKYRIPASITLAQAILESAAGTSYLAKEANNHFGIKCSDWTGARAYKDAEVRNECFRKYSSIAESYEDHSKFLTERPRYERLFLLRKTDYKGWAKGLQECGYATDKGYANKLIRIIELYQLYLYNSDSSPDNRRVEQTRPVTQTTPPATNDRPAALSRNIYKTYGLIYVIARYNDSLDAIARDVGFKAKTLAKYNEIPVGYPLQQGDIIYLEKKKKIADQPNFNHTVRVGESMYSISQRYGIQLNSLYKLNNRNADYAPLEGDILKLR